MTCLPIAQAGGTGLYYYRARYYSPGLQRFISEDPIGLLGGDVNFYVYVWSDPVNWIDPLGLDPILPGGQCNPVLRCHVAPHNDPMENLTGAVIIGGILIAPQAIVTTTSIAKATIYVGITNPQLIYKTVDFVQGAIVPGPPPSTPAGYAGGIYKEIIDRVGPIIDEQCNR
jgi:RHS repeat-associated protein